ncbi:MAG: hypothetical protein QME64_03575 [bacterium]|nr:hypothetical protein [bacterium]
MKVHFRLSIRFIITIACVNYLASNLFAWPAINGIAICTAAFRQEYPQISPDESGGAIMVWHDTRSGDYDIYAQRVNNAGFTLWNLNGVAICTAAVDQYEPFLVSDGTGGAFITWMDYRNTTDFDIYAQRVNSEGSIMWLSDGVAICTVTNHQWAPKLVSDRSDGAIITWFDFRGFYSDIFAQRINGVGSTLWSLNGMAVCSASNSQFTPQLISDGTSGAIITWEDWRRGSDNADIYAQRINSIGSTLWALNGVAICTAGGDQRYPYLVSDGLGGAIITWIDNRSGYSNHDIYAQRVNENGQTLWNDNGIAICIDTGDLSYPKIISDGANGAIITWEDYRNGTAYSDIYVQRVNREGSTMWVVNGIAICTGDNHQYDPEIASDGSGGAIIIWTNRSGSYNDDIYAQRVNSDGQTLWATNGIPICAAEQSQRNQQLIIYGSGFAIIVWEDNRNGTPYGDIYAQQIYPSGLPVAVAKEYWELY